MVKIISYYTAVYANEAARLVESLKKFNLDHCVEELPSLGSWDQNTRQKIPYIMKKIKEGPVLWTDSDSVIQQYPNLIFELNCDIAIHKFRTHTPHYLSGTIFFNNTPKSIAFLEQWKQYADSQEYANNNSFRPLIKGDQGALNVLLSKPHDLNIYELPPEYCFIFDLSKNIHKDVKPVIEHFQASRRLKRIVK
jgi:hypothetical protein